MIQMSQQWNPQALATIEATAFEGIQRATVYLWTKVVEALNVSNPRPYTTPSAPGEPPRKRTGTLQRSVLYELDERARVGRVGVSRLATYGIFLELGSRKMEARSFLLSTLNRSLPKLRELAQSGK